MPDKTTIHMVSEPLKSELVNATYGIVGAMIEVYKNLGAGMPEYVYQEALMSELTANDITAYKELAYHPLYKGEPLNTYIKMDMVAECPEGRVIVECKAMWQLTERERYQVFGYLRATEWPAVVLVNFGASPRAQIERYRLANSKIVAF